MSCSALAPLPLQLGAARAIPRQKLAARDEVSETD